MVKLRFAPYEVSDSQADSSQTWVLLWQALHNPQWTLGADKSGIRNTVGLFEAMHKLAVKTGTDGQMNNHARLNPGGGELVLQETEFELLQDAWNRFYPGLPRWLAGHALRVQTFLDVARPQS